MSHASGECPYAGGVKVREPVARPLDLVAVELLLTASQAFLVGVLMYLAIGVWDDRGVGVGPVAVILALLGLAIGGSWLYWLLGGVGWPMAAANVPVAMFLGFMLVLGWSGEDLFRVPGVPLLIAVLAAGFGVVCGVFLDSPRRWRWDQRQKLRPGTTVPRVSATTQAVVAQVPRSLPTRPRRRPDNSDLAARIERSAPAGVEPGGDVGSPYVAGGGDGADVPANGVEEAAALDREPASDGLSAAALDKEEAPPASLAAGAGIPDSDGAIELPTSVEPRAQRSPWAWAAPPEWNRDEDDDAMGRGSSRRS